MQKTSRTFIVHITFPHKSCRRLCAATRSHIIWRKTWAYVHFFVISAWRQRTLPTHMWLVIATKLPSHLNVAREFEKIEPAFTYAAFGSVASTQNHHARPAFEPKLHYIFRSQYAVFSVFLQISVILRRLRCWSTSYTTYAQHLQICGVCHHMLLPQAHHLQQRPHRVGWMKILSMNLHTIDIWQGDNIFALVSSRMVIYKNM